MTKQGNCPLGAGLPPEFIAEAGAHIMLCSGLGPKAARTFKEFGIDEFIGASGTVQDALPQALFDLIMIHAISDNYD